MDRVFDWNEINYDVPQHDEVEQTVQAARCMDCGKQIDFLFRYHLKKF